MRITFYEEEIMEVVAKKMTEMLGINIKPHEVKIHKGMEDDAVEAHFYLKTKGEKS